MMLLTLALAPLSALSILAALRAPCDESVSTPVPGPAVSTAERCARCHADSPSASAMHDAAGRSVAPYGLWRSTMMANSARDPFWRAVMSAEMAATPSAAERIAAKCMRCHTPLADRVGLLDHDTGSPVHALECEGELGELARDGVSCTICHGMAPEGLGTAASFGAGFSLDPERRLFGPHRDPFPTPMQRMAGFTPTHGEHVLRSQLCGSCHTLETHALSADGAETGEVLPEQTPYLEWRNSAYSDEDSYGELLAEPPVTARTCQSCHLPTVDEEGAALVTRIAHNPGGRDFPFLVPRVPYGRHLLVGGNTFVLGLLREHREVLGVQASAEELDATLAATRAQLETRSATLKIAHVGRSGDDEVFEVVVRNLGGHKLPTGHPSRRAWLEVVAKDAAGRVLLHSGRFGADGRIVGADGTVLDTERRGGPIEAHRREVHDSGQVVRYRAVMADADGAPTFLLLRGGHWWLDDRILPKGWTASHPDAASTAPVGTPGDPDYESADPASGEDHARFFVPRGEARVVSVEARLLYQSVSPRYVDEIAAFPTPETARFLSMYEAADRRPELLAVARWSAALEPRD